MSHPHLPLSLPAVPALHAAFLQHRRSARKFMIFLLAAVLRCSVGSLGRWLLADNCGEDAIASTPVPESSLSAALHTCRDGSLGRWLLEYSTSGDMLIRAATYEHYPAAKTA
jgi:hypothetical protein